MISRVLFSAVLLLALPLAYAQLPGPEIPPSVSFPRAGGGLPNARMGGGGTVTGSVLTIDNHPVTNARIDIRSMDGTALIATGYSNASGAFEISDLPPGEYQIVATAGLRESHQGIEVQATHAWVTLRMANDDASDAGGRTSVSVAGMQVPEKARKELKKALEVLDRGKLDEALKYADQALAIYPDYAEALTLHGIVHIRQGDLDGGRTALEKAVQCDSSFGMGYIALASAYNTQERFDDAVRVVERGINLAPDSWQGYFERARALERKQQWEASLRDVTKAEQLLNKEFPVLHLVKANDLIGLKSYAAAQAELKAYLQRDSTGPNAAEARRVLENINTLIASANK